MSSIKTPAGNDNPTNLPPPGSFRNQQEELEANRTGSRWEVTGPPSPAVIKFSSGDQSNGAKEGEEWSGSSKKLADALVKSWGSKKLQRDSGRIVNNNQTTSMNGGFNGAPREISNNNYAGSEFSTNVDPSMNWNEAIAELNIDPTINNRTITDNSAYGAQSQFDRNRGTDPRYGAQQAVQQPNRGYDPMADPFAIQGQPPKPWDIPEQTYASSTIPPQPTKQPKGKGGDFSIVDFVKNPIVIIVFLALVLVGGFFAHKQIENDNLEQASMGVPAPGSPSTDASGSTTMSTGAVAPPAITPAPVSGTGAMFATNSAKLAFSKENDVTILTTPTKVTWLDKEINAFNGSNLDGYHVTRTRLLESRDGMQAILSGQMKPTIFSPSSPVWLSRLNDVYTQNHRGEPLADMDDPQAYRSLMSSPLVIITTKQKAPFYEPIFHSAYPWHQIADLSTGRNHTPWGTFSFAHADPLDTSSGMMTICLILWEYCAETGQTQDIDSVAKSDGFHHFLAEVEGKFIYDPEAFGSSDLEKKFAANPGNCDFITMYENKALEAVQKNPNLQVIYPSNTALSEQTAVVLSAPWVNQRQRDGAIAFLAFLASNPALADAVAFNFRPNSPNPALALDTKLRQHAPQGFQVPFQAIPLPDYGAINAASEQFDQIIHARLASNK